MRKATKTEAAYFAPGHRLALRERRIVIRLKR
jgi:hypothetical protein